ncbi:MAG: 50S ribosomal protein L2 [Candidatus Niyogibacteria bacterium CG10_big_fil_rev_8_21_14_0_10_42_19]|uniref:Large ribosomal subunit protein uL2 n=1 Tax=Candidatus Niyogibacteria bacterium CG10_big_fil_rev_8_21_14_0_10_42_19 TaxID=1974725 RepID=A0A2H0THF1_9BACT|nr:MAG: 50S ribosomal protein L2 [Candidatus Niyogibacteria bacterium CG10_big_fil_rev_8_21_14_0_10_42_19]
MKSFKPTTPSRRQTTVVSYRKHITASEPHKALTRGRKRRKGRASWGRITTRHKGGGAKRLWREIDFRYNKIGIPARVLSVEYDPNRSGFIGLVLYRDGERRYHLLPEGLKVGDEIVTSDKAELKPGNRLPLGLIPVGSQAYNVEINPMSGSSLVRSAGNYAEVLAHDAGYTLIKLPSGSLRKVNSRSWASVGQVSNNEYDQVVYGKAGRSRWMGIRPTVRGSAMNPVDHPYGGGEGRALRGTRRPKNRWGKGTRGVKTRNRKKYSNALIVQRRKKK